MQLNAWLSNIAEKMQAASFSPNSIERMTRELADHHQDILDASATNDSNKAIARLGTVDSILNAAEHQRTGSMAWFHFLILPLLQLVFVWISFAAISLFVVNLFAMIGINANQASSPMAIRVPLGLLWSGVPVWAALFVSWRAYKRTMFRDNCFAWSVVAFCMIASAVATMESPVHFPSNSMEHGFNTDFSLAWFYNPFRIVQILVPVAFLVVGYRKHTTPAVCYSN
jgi:hypothetical protein